MRWQGKLLWFISKFVLFLILFALIWPFLAPGYCRMLIQPSNKLLALEGIPIQLRLEEDSIQALSTKTFGPQGPTTKPFPFSWGIFWSYEVLLLIALFLATPNLKPFKRLELTAVALGAIFIYNVVDLNLGIRSIYHPSSFYDWAYMLSTLGQLWVPLLLWGLLTFRYWLPMPRMKVKIRSGEIGRNDPCPCGSGKKYKLCCGR
jgi:hypothetical protein